jgi:hypothetical protein
MECSNCHQQVPDTANVCGHCGQRLKFAAPAMLVCPNCKAQNRPDVRFCEECGASLTGQVAPVQSTPQPVAQTAPPQRVQPAPGATAQPAGFGLPVWGFRQWIVGALIWTVAYLIMNLIMIAVSFYVISPEMQTRWPGFLSFYNAAYGGTPWFQALLVWGVPGLLAGGFKKSALRMLLGFAICVPIGALAVAVSKPDASIYIGIRNSLDMAPAFGALIAIWIGERMKAPRGFLLVIRWIGLVWCGSLFGIWAMEVVGSFTKLNNNTFAPVLFILAGILLAFFVGARERKRSKAEGI